MAGVSLTPRDRLAIDHTAQVIGLNQEHGGIYILVAPLEKQTLIAAQLQARFPGCVWQEIDPGALETGDVLESLAGQVQVGEYVTNTTLFSLSLYSLEDLNRLKKLLQALNYR